MKKKRNTSRNFIIAAVVAAALLAASFLLDGVAAAAVKSIQSQYLTASVDAFNKFYIWIYAAMLAATMAAMLKTGTKDGKGRRIAVMAASIITAVAVTHLLKPIIHRLRPDGMLFVNPIQHWQLPMRTDSFELSVFENVDYSFPSGHTTAAAAGAFSAPPMLRIPWIAFTAATIFARVYSSAHFLSDTVGGLIVAAAVGAFVKSKLKEKLTTEDMIEIRRQAMHAIVGIAIAVFIWSYPSLWYVVLAVAMAGMALFYSIKKATADKNRAIRKFRKIAVALLKLVERKEELQRFPGKGAIMLFAGSAITAAIFRKEAVAAIVILAVGDSVSHLAGRLFGRIRHKWIFAEEKTIEGSFSGFVYASVAASILLPVWIAVAAAAAAMTVEAAKIKLLGKKIDDNLTVPFVAAAVIFGIKHIF